MPEYDNSYKLLFSHPEMVVDLLRGFVRDPWVEEVDFGSLELVSRSFVSDDLRDREDDIIWRARWKGQWLYLYLLLEFQSTVDSFMAVRIMVYVGLLYQDLLRTGQVSSSGPLPPVLPVVLYNGIRLWTAQQDVAELIAKVPGGLEVYQPRLRYLLLEENRYTETELAPLHNLVAALFRLENSRQPEDMQRVLRLLVDWLQSPEETSLRRAFTHWLRRVLLPARMPGVTLPEMQNLQEVTAMLEERMLEWTEQWKQEGLQQGLRQGEFELLLRQLEHKFGPLDESQRRRVAEADAETLLRWGDRILTAQRWEEVIA